MTTLSRTVVLVACAVFTAAAQGQTVICSEPYEDDCHLGDYVLSCQLIFCETNYGYNPEDPESYPVICPEGATETTPQLDSQGNPVKFHLGILPVEDGEGFYYFSNQQTLCSATRACDEDENCDFDAAGFFCPANPHSDLWTPNTELFYVGVEGEECEEQED